MKKYEPELEQIDNDIKERQRKYAGPFCCLTAHTSIESNRGPLRYEPDTRNYLLDINDDYAKALAIFCPWCGEKLPEPLDQEWYKILEEEYKIESPDLQENRTK